MKLILNDMQMRALRLRRAAWAAIVTGVLFGAFLVALALRAAWRAS